MGIGGQTESNGSGVPTDRTPDPDPQPTARTPTGTVHPIAWAPVTLVAAAVLIAQFIGSALSSGYWLDEAYMLAIGRNHLDWGSADQPPVAPAISWLMDQIAPGNLFVLRLPVMVATATSVVVAAFIARELGGDRRAQILTALAQGTGLFMAVAGHWATPYGYEPFEWVVLFWILLRWMRTRDDRLLLALGVMAGIALMTKFQVALLAAVLLAAIAILGPRALLGRPALWAGICLASLIALPTLIWQALNDWPQLAMAPVVAAEAEEVYGGRTALAWQLIGFAGALAPGLMLAALWWMGRDPAWRDYRFLGAGYVVLYAFFVITEGRSYYLLGYVGVLAAAGAVGFQRRRMSRDHVRRWPAWVVATVAVVLAAGTVGVSSAVTPESQTRGIVETIAAAHRSLPDVDHTAIIGESYVYAAYVDAYAKQFALPAAYSTNRGYGYFEPPPEADVNALYVGDDPKDFRPYFASVRPVASTDPDIKLWLLTGRSQPWESFWPALRHLAIV